MAALRPAIDRLRSELPQVSLQYGDSDPLPLTVSAGICAFPLDADSVTGLLSIAAMTLGEAKSSGGDAVRVAEAAGATPAFTKSFDILQGLVIAIDTKDRYTKRHSEDVARYADFLADRLGPGHRSFARRSTSRGCSTMSGRSASRTRSCASRRS